MFLPCKFILTVSILCVQFFIAVNGQGLCFSEHNAERAKNGKSPLQYNSKLEKAAKTHSDFMSSNNCFNHECPGEPKVGDRIKKAGYTWRSYAENIAKGQKDCKDVMKSWMNSPGHKKNILGPYKDVGCAKINSYWTCNFGTSA